MTIIYLGVIDWHYLRQRPQQLALELSRYHRVVYAHPRTLLATWRARRRLPAGATAAWIEHAGEDGMTLHLYQPALLPGRRGAFLQSLTRRLFLAGLTRQLARRGWPPDAIWVGHPSQEKLLAAFPGVPVVYDCMDNWAAFPGGSGMAAAENRLLAGAQLVLASSRALQERLSSRHPRVQLIPNGVELAHFRRSLEQRATAAEGAPGRDPRPVALTFGTFGSWIDFELISAIARTAPGWRFQLVGPIETAPSGGVPVAENLEWLSARPYSELPRLMAEADVAFLPFRLDDLTRSVDPIKVYEFLSAGLPVVAVPLPELDKFKQGIFRATDGPGFAAALQEAHRSVTDTAARRALSDSVGDHTWAARGAEVSRLMSATLTGFRRT